MSSLTILLIILAGLAGLLLLVAAIAGLWLRRQRKAEHRRKGLAGAF